jgi:hypothetical protein
MTNKPHPNAVPTQERNQVMFEARVQGDTYQTIADRHGVSKERVQRIVEREARRRGLPFPVGGKRARP